jgi:hypothetical protein
VKRKLFEQGDQLPCFDAFVRHVLLGDCRKITGYSVWASALHAGIQDLVATISDEIVCYNIQRYSNYLISTQLA